MKRALAFIKSAWLAALIGLGGALVLTNWAACDAYDKFCALTGVPR